MASKTDKKPVSRRMWLIDPIYRKFTAKAFETLTGSEFYSFFQTMMRNGEHEFQFSNRKLDIQVDERWVEIIEATIPAFIEISRNPRVIIMQEELITNVVQARKIDSQVVKHLCGHSYLVESVDEDDNVRPEKVLNIFKEESWNTYENRFVFTLMKKTYDFIAKRYRDMKDALSDEYGATLLIKSTGNSDLETLSIDTKLHITQIDDFFDTNNKQGSIFGRIQYIWEAMNNLMTTRFAKEMAKFSRVDPPLVATNAIKKNPFLRKCHKLWDFLLTYYDVGYTIQIIEQNPEINQKFEQDIFDNIMFTYIILKGYLEDNRDRAMDRNVKSQRRVLRPRYIKEIVEDIVRDYNLPDVEVRKILIEQLTKEQLMREERSEQYRLVEEKKKSELEKRRQAELERARRAKERERQKKQQEKEKEKERIRLEKERAKEKLRLEKEKEKKAAADAKRAELFEQELTLQLESITARRSRKNGTAKRPSAAKKATGETGTAAKKAPASAEKKKPSAPKKTPAKTAKTTAKTAPAEPKQTTAKKQAESTEKPIKTPAENQPETAPATLPAAGTETPAESVTAASDPPDAAVILPTAPETNEAPTETPAEPVTATTEISDAAVILPTAPETDETPSEVRAETPAEPVAELPAEPPVEADVQEIADEIARAIAEASDAPAENAPDGETPEKADSGRFSLKKLLGRKR